MVKKIKHCQTLLHIPSLVSLSLFLSFFLSPTPFILRVSPGSCRGWTPAHYSYYILFCSQWKRCRLPARILPELQERGVVYKQNLGVKFYLRLSPDRHDQTLWSSRGYVKRICVIRKDLQSIFIKECEHMWLCSRFKFLLEIRWIPLVLSIIFPLSPYV